MDKNNISKIAQTPEDKILLAKIFDKISAGISRDIPVNTGFLSQREQHMAHFLLGNTTGLTENGGYEDAERKMILYTPDYMDPSDHIPYACIRATYYEEKALNHRDFLGALLGLGITRECIGDICVGNNSCDFLVTAEIAPFIVENFTSAGRIKLKVSQIDIQELSVPTPEIQIVCESVASLRIDNMISAGFGISRTAATDAIGAGRVNIDGLPCLKSDKTISPGTVISVRGYGKIKFESINGQTRKGRISVNIGRYV